ncbi:rCG57485 [Rattus norvegicus]|uniref:RCG57485 n=1 Tax=Rattus norvegicus TaxID=10116 RepID=A6JI63_RAT|nr:rCG57485 [Rattus norvegicus]
MYLPHGCRGRERESGATKLELQVGTSKRTVRVLTP